MTVHEDYLVSTIDIRGHYYVMERLVDFFIQVPKQLTNKNLPDQERFIMCKKMA
jgi:hypothetical protein